MLDDETLAEVIEEPVDIRRFARREANALAWAAAATPAEVTGPATAPNCDPCPYAEAPNGRASAS